MVCSVTRDTHIKGGQMMMIPEILWRRGWFISATTPFEFIQYNYLQQTWIDSLYSSQSAINKCLFYVEKMPVWCQCVCTAWGCTILHTRPLLWYETNCHWYKLSIYFHSITTAVHSFMSLPGLQYTAAKRKGRKKWIFGK